MSHHHTNYEFTSEQSNDERDLLKVKFKIDLIIMFSKLFKPHQVEAETMAKLLFHYPLHVEWKQTAMPELLLHS